MDLPGIYFGGLETRSLGSSATSTLPLTTSMTSHLRELAYVRRHPVEGRRANAVHGHQTRTSAGPTSSSARTAGQVICFDFKDAQKQTYFLQILRAKFKLLYSFNMNFLELIFGLLIM